MADYAEYNERYKTGGVQGVNSLFMLSTLQEIRTRMDVCECKAEARAIDLAIDLYVGVGAGNIQHSVDRLIKELVRQGYKVKARRG